VYKPFVLLTEPQGQGMSLAFQKFSLNLIHRKDEWLGTFSGELGTRERRLNATNEKMKRWNKDHELIKELQRFHIYPHCYPLPRMYKMGWSYIERTLWDCWNATCWGESKKPGCIQVERWEVWERQLCIFSEQFQRVLVTIGLLLLLC
jgi:hypothetical protein